MWKLSHRLRALTKCLDVCRFNPQDERCGMELDDINPDKWAALEAATDEYIVREDAAFDDAARALCSRLASGTAFDPSQERLGEFCSISRRAVPGRREGAWESGLAAMMLAPDRCICLSTGNVTSLEACSHCRTVLHCESC